MLSHLLSFIQAGSPHQTSQLTMLSMKQLSIAETFTGEQIELLPAGLIRADSLYLPQAFACMAAFKPTMSAPRQLDFSLLIPAPMALAFYEVIA